MGDFLYLLNLWILLFLQIGIGKFLIYKIVRSSVILLLPLILNIQR